MCEIGAESKWMLRNVSEMVDAFGKETLTEKWVNYLCGWGKERGRDFKLLILYMD